MTNSGTLQTDRVSESENELADVDQSDKDESASSMGASSMGVVRKHLSVVKSKNEQSKAAEKRWQLGIVANDKQI